MARTGTWTTVCLLSLVVACAAEHESDEEDLREPPRADAGLVLTEQRPMLPEPVYPPVSGPNYERPAWTNVAQDKAWIAACTVPCDVECNRPGSVFTYDEESGAELFRADATASGSVCAAALKLGTRVTTIAEPQPGFAFARWRAGAIVSQGLPCACEGSSVPSCTFDVREHSYCGAVFTQLTQ